jgi:hypothetical protein
MENWLAGWISAGSLSRPVSSSCRALHVTHGKKPAFFTRVATSDEKRSSTPVVLLYHVLLFDNY